MKIKAAIIGMGIGEKHLNAIDKYRGCKVKIICEKNKKKLKKLQLAHKDCIYYLIKQLYDSTKYAILFIAFSRFFPVIEEIFIISISFGSFF